jgi:hypothetical protein
MDFVVIHLASQSQAVKQYVKTWTPRQIIAWLQTYGMIIKVHPNFDEYFFIATSGLVTEFGFDDEKRLYINPFCDFYLTPESSVHERL